MCKSCTQFDRILWVTRVNEMSSESSEIARPQVSGKINLLKWFCAVALRIQIMISNYRFNFVESYKCFALNTFWYKLKFC